MGPEAGKRHSCHKRWEWWPLGGARINCLSTVAIVDSSPGQDGHQGALTCLVSNKDGSLVLTGSVDGYAKLINTATGKVGARETRQQTGNGKAVQKCP